MTKKDKIIWYLNKELTFKNFSSLNLNNYFRNCFNVWRFDFTATPQYCCSFIHNENSEAISKKSIKENNNDSLVEKLKKLKSLFETNLITKEEYDEKRKEILDENF